MSPERKPIPPDLILSVLVKSKRRCCLCYGLNNDIREHKGHIAHLDHDPSNCQEDNLAWLCLGHHDDYDSGKTHSKNYILGEVKAYRKQLYDKMRFLVFLDSKNPDINEATLESQCAAQASLDDTETTTLRTNGSDKPPPTISGDRYTLTVYLGGGASGDVYRALDAKLDRVVAVKILPIEDSDNKESIERLVREAKALARCDHEHIVKIYDVETSGPRPYIVMEYVEGGKLRDAVSIIGDLNKRLSFLVRISRALSYAHDKGIIHRDLNPNNILVDQNCSPKLVDFGWAKVVGIESITSANQGGIGTPHYMSPEQMRSQKDVTHLTDIYSFGCNMHYTLLGRDPELQATFNEIDPRCANAIKDIYTQCTCDNPSGRPESMDIISVGLQQAITKIAEPDNIRSIYSTRRIPVSVKTALRTSSAKIMTRDQIKVILREAHNKGEDFYLFCALSVNHGLYLSEILHIRHGDIRGQTLRYIMRKARETITLEEILLPQEAAIIRNIAKNKKASDWLFPGRSRKGACPCTPAKSGIGGCGGGHISKRHIQVEFDKILYKLGMKEGGRNYDCLRAYNKRGIVSADPDDRRPIL